MWRDTGNRLKLCILNLLLCESAAYGKSMPKNLRSQLLRYGGAVLLVAIATLARALLTPLIGNTLQYFTYVLAVIFAAYYYRLGPALVATALGAVAARYYFISPIYSLAMTGGMDWLRLVTYFTIGISVTLLSESVHRIRIRGEQAAFSLKQQHKWLQVTLASIGDAVIATDAEGRITFINRVAQSLTGWTRYEAVGKPLETIFKIIDEQTREPIESPAKRVMRERSIVGMSSRALLVARDGTEIPIDDSGAPIEDDTGKVEGVVLVFRDITDRQRADEEMRKSEERYRELFENANDIVYTLDLDGNLTSINKRGEEITGYSRQEIIGQNIAPFIDPGDVQLMQQALLRKQDGEQLTVYEMNLLANGGRKVRLEVSSRLIYKNGDPVGIQGIARDITERKQIAERQKFLAEAGTVLASSLDYEITLKNLARLATPALADWCTVHILEEGGDIRPLAIAYSDPSAVELINQLQDSYPLDENAPQGAAKVIRTGEPEFYAEIPESLLEQTARDKEHLKFLRSLGMKSAMIVPLQARGRTLGAMTFVTTESGRHYTTADFEIAGDLAHRAALALDNARLYHEAKTAIESREEALNLRDELLVREQVARAEAESANRAKDEFLATVSHELRTPLNAMLGWAHMLRKGLVVEEDTERALETIERNARAQAQIIDDILDVSRIITGKLRLDVRPVELAPIIEEAIFSTQPAAEAKEIDLQFSLDPGTSPVSGDPDRLQQVAWNLLANAVKFTPGGGRIEVRLCQVDSYAQLSISDTGQGIDPEFVPRVFDRFLQADSTSTRLHGGLGLGLAIVRYLVEMHGGEVSAESPGLGLGSTFTVRLPILTARRKESHPELVERRTTEERSAERSPLLDGVRVLVVDDDSDTREMVALALAERQADVKTCSSVGEALDAFKEWKPDVLVSDIQMPEQDGYELITEVRHLERDRDEKIPAVALTAYARSEDRARALQLGYNVHVSKPVDPAELVMVVAGLAGRLDKVGNI